MCVISCSEKALESPPKLGTQARSALGPQPRLQPLSIFASNQTVSALLKPSTSQVTIEKKVSFVETGIIGGWWTITREFRWKLLWDCDDQWAWISVLVWREDVEMLEMVLERTYTCSRGTFSSKAYAACDPAERISFLLLDKELLSVEGMRQLSFASPSYHSVSLLTPLLVLNPGFPFLIIFHNFWQKSKGKPGAFHT